MGWYPMKTAPKDGTPIRVRVVRSRELPWRVFYKSRRWRYLSTKAPLHHWHKPVEWTFDPYRMNEAKELQILRVRAFGTRVLPSGFISARVAFGQSRDMARLAAKGGGE